MEREAHLQGILHISQKPHLSGSPVNEPSPKFPFMESPTERCPTATALPHSSIEVPGIRAPPHTKFPLDGKGPHGERCPYPESFLTYLPGSPLPRPTPRILVRDMLHPQSPLYPALKVPSR